MSARTMEGIPEAWEKMQEFYNKMLEAGELTKERSQQHKIWMWSHIKEQIMARFKSNKKVQQKISKYELLVFEGIMTPGRAADLLLKVFTESSK